MLIVCAVKCAYDTVLHMAMHGKYYETHIKSISVWSSFHGRCTIYVMSGGHCSFQNVTLRQYPTVKLTENIASAGIKVARIIST